MRGALPDLRRPATRPRIIPADAVSTIIWIRTWKDRKDHPRGCGEHAEVGEIPGAEKGSSPRMRGALGGNVSLPDFRRIIPADAGSTQPETGRICHTGDHPRGCGEHLMYGEPSMPNMGSSPRMRGALSIAAGYAK